MTPASNAHAIIHQRLELPPCRLRRALSQPEFEPCWRYYQLNRGRFRSSDGRALPYQAVADRIAGYLRESVERRVAAQYVARLVSRAW